MPECLGEGGARGAKPTLAQVALGQVAGLSGQGFTWLALTSGVPGFTIPPRELVTTQCDLHPQLGPSRSYRGCELAAAGWGLRGKTAAPETTPVWDNWRDTHYLILCPPCVFLSALCRNYRGWCIYMMLMQKDGRLATWLSGGIESVSSAF